MHPKTTLSISLTYRRPEDIKEVQRLSQELNKTKWTQADLFLLGMRTAVSMINKAKDVVK